MRLPQSTKSRVWTAIAALGALAVIIFGITAYNLWQDGNGPAASGSKGGSSLSPIPSAPTSFPTFQGTPPAGAGLAGFPGGNGPGTVGYDPFAKGGNDTRLHTVSFTISSDGAAYVGYRYRDGKGSGLKIISKNYSITRSVHGPLPVVLIGVQVLSNGTYATCSVAIDGVVTNSTTAHGSGHVTICSS